jgi:hypothetical protein
LTSSPSLLPEPSRLRTATDKALGVIMAIAIAPLLLAIAHYQFWLRLFTGPVVTVEPGKWVWVECRTQASDAMSEGIGFSGVTLRGEADVTGVPCPSVGITSLGNDKYFFPEPFCLFRRQVAFAG